MENLKGHLVYEEVNKIRAERKGYGDIKKNFGVIASLWSSYLDEIVSDTDVANMMALLKIARSKGDFKLDNFVDGVNYLAIAGELSAAEYEWEKDLQKRYPHIFNPNREEADWTAEEKQNVANFLGIDPKEPKQTEMDFR